MRVLEFQNFSSIQFQLLQSLFTNTRYTKPVNSVKNEKLKKTWVESILFSNIDISKFIKKLDHWIMQFESSYWLNHNSICTSHYTILHKYGIYG